MHQVAAMILHEECIVTICAVSIVLALGCSAAPEDDGGSGPASTSSTAATGGSGGTMGSGGEGGAGGEACPLTCTPSDTCCYDIIDMVHVCVDTTSDWGNCGACNTNCPITHMCIDSMCQMP
jgi:hypothetical protein